MRRTWTRERCVLPDGGVGANDVCAGVPLRSFPCQDKARYCLLCCASVSTACVPSLEHARNYRGILGIWRCTQPCRSIALPECIKLCHSLFGTEAFQKELLQKRRDTEQFFDTLFLMSLGMFTRWEPISWVRFYPSCTPLGTA